MDRRVAIQDALGPLQDFIAANDDVFGGLWIDQRHGAQIMLQTTSSAMPLVAKARDLIPPGASVDIVSAKRSQASLQKQADTIASQFAALAAAGTQVVSVGVDAPTNEIEVGVAGATEADRAALSDKLAPDVRVVAAEPLHSVSLPTSCYGIVVCPLRAGLDISNLGYDECTSGYFFHDISSGIIWTSTAGHCFSSSWPSWYLGRTTTYYIGGNVFWSYHNGMNVDAGFIYQSSSMSKNLVYVSSGEKGRAMNGFLTNSQQTSGAVTCAAGATSGYRCNYVNGTNMTVNTSVGTWYHAWRAGFGSGNGDSGGPVFYGSKEMGMVDATSGGNTYYSTIDWIDSDFGVYPCVTTSC